MEKAIYNTFKKGSKTYFYSSIFFPAKAREEVFILYSFVRKTDDFVDAIPQQKTDFYNFCRKYREAIKGKNSGDIIIDSFISLSKKLGFESGWIDAFLISMEKDLTKKKYNDLEETLEYIYGSAEVIGLMMSKIMRLHPDSFLYAKMVGRSMQYINFIRDLNLELNPL